MAKGDQKTMGDSSPALQGDVPAVILTASDVLALIDPVDPDSVTHLGAGVYEAKWYDDAEGRTDLACLQAGSLINVIGDMYVPAGLPAWIAIKFSVKYVPTISTVVQ
jgi:hypothetical protein